MAVALQKLAGTHGDRRLHWPEAAVVASVAV
jgi:hypothetical protein